jgi:hypothetical protein
MHFNSVMKLVTTLSRKKTFSLTMRVSAALGLVLLQALFQPAAAEEEQTIRLSRKSARPRLFGNSSKLTERDVYDFVVAAKITCPRRTKSLLKKEGIEFPMVKARESLYLSMMEGLTNLSKISPSVADRLLVRMKAFPLGISCVSAIKKLPKDLYLTVVQARLSSSLKRGRDDLGSIYQPTDIVKACGKGSLEMDTDDCQLCGRSYVSETDGKISVTSTWEDRVASKDSCENLNRTQSSFIQK